MAVMEFDFVILKRALYKQATFLTTWTSHVKNLVINDAVSSLCLKSRFKNGSQI